MKITLDEMNIENLTSDGWVILREQENAFEWENEQIAIAIAEEEDYHRHIALEDNSVTWNTHPDGCYYCGSDLHHSDCCPQRP